jgi:hypothetical protein
MPEANSKSETLNPEQILPKIFSLQDACAETKLDKIFEDARKIYLGDFSAKYLHLNAPNIVFASSRDSASRENLGHLELEIVPLKTGSSRFLPIVSLLGNLGI